MRADSTSVASASRSQLWLGMWRLPSCLRVSWAMSTTTATTEFLLCGQWVSTRSTPRTLKWLSISKWCSVRWSRLCVHKMSPDNPFGIACKVFHRLRTLLVYYRLDQGSGAFSAVPPEKCEPFESFRFWCILATGSYVESTHAISRPRFARLTLMHSTSSLT